MQLRYRHLYKPDPSAVFKPRKGFVKGCSYRRRSWLPKDPESVGVETFVASHDGETPGVIVFFEPARADLP